MLLVLIHFNYCVADCKNYLLGIKFSPLLCGWHTKYTYTQLPHQLCIKKDDLCQNVNQIMKHTARAFFDSLLIISRYNLGNQQCAFTHCRFQIENRNQIDFFFHFPFLYLINIMSSFSCIYQY